MEFLSSEAEEEGCEGGDDNRRGDSLVMKDCSLLVSSSSSSSSSSLLLSSSAAAASTTSASSDHLLEKRHFWKEFYASLHEKKKKSFDSLEVEAIGRVNDKECDNSDNNNSNMREEDINEEVRSIVLSMRDSWSEIRKDSSKGLRRVSCFLSPRVVNQLLEEFMNPLITMKKSHKKKNATKEEIGLKSAPKLGGARIHEEKEQSTDTPWQVIHGSLLGLYALLPLLAAEEKSASTSSSFDVEDTKEICLECLSHAQLPVRDVSRNCLHEMSHCLGSLGISFLDKCLTRLNILTREDNSKKSEDQASEIDGLLSYIGYMLYEESLLLIGNQTDEYNAVDEVLSALNGCMHHLSSTVRQRSAYVLSNCYKAFPDGSSNTTIEMKQNETQGALMSRRQFLDGIVGVILNALIDITEWRALEGYLLVVEDLLQRLQEARIEQLRGAITNEGIAFLASDRLVHPLINQVPRLLCHDRFEIRRMSTQLLPSLARVIVLKPTETDMKSLLPLEEDIVAMSLSKVALWNELFLAVQSLQEVQDESKCRNQSLDDSHTVEDVMDEELQLCSLHKEWTKLIRRRAGEEEKQASFHSAVSSWGTAVEQARTFDDCLHECRRGMLPILKALKHLSASFCAVGISSVDVLEACVLAAAVTSRWSDVEVKFLWPQYMAALQRVTYCKKTPRQACNAVIDLISKRTFPLEDLEEAVTVLPSVTDPSVSLEVFNLSQCDNHRAIDASKVSVMAANQPNANSANKSLLEAVYPAVPGLLHTLSLEQLVTCALLWGHWAYCLMVDPSWRIGWGSKPSSRRSTLETLDLLVQIIELRLRSPHSIEKHNLPMVAASFEAIGHTISTSFVSWSKQDELQLGSAAKFDLKSGVKIADICLIITRQLMSSVPNCRSSSAKWNESTLELCEYILSKLNPDSSSGNCSDSIIDNADGNAEDDEFSDWDDSESDDENAGEERNSFHSSLGNISAGNFDVMLVNNCIREIKSLLLG